MAVGVIIISVLSMFAVVIAWGSFAPVSQELGTDLGRAWSGNTCGINNTARPDCVARDTTYKAILILPLFMIITIAAWMFLTLSRKDVGSI